MFAFAGFAMAYTHCTWWLGLDETDTSCR